MQPDTTPTDPSDRSSDPTAIERVADVLRHEPNPRGLRAAVELDVVLGRLERQLDALRAGVEAALDLPMSQLYVLRAVDDGARTIRAVAAATPLSPAAAATDVAQLREDGLLTRDAAADVSADPRLALTARGRARLGQADALRLRVLADLADEADPVTLDAVAALTTRTDPRA